MKGKQKPGIEKFNTPGFTLDEDFKELRQLYAQIKDKIRLPSLALRLEEKETLIPSCVFNKKLSAFESVVKYMKENKGMANKEIANVLSKSQKSIWQTYNQAAKKYAKRLEIMDSSYHIPVSIFRKPFTILEAIVKHLKEQAGMNYHEIALLLKRDERTIWTVYDRARKRNG
jgi:hypothetical protein